VYIFISKVWNDIDAMNKEENLKSFDEEREFCSLLYPKRYHSQL